MKLVCFHLFNDFSGSPKVLKVVLEGLLERGHEVHLVTSRGGALDSISHKRFKRHSYSYRFSPNMLVTLMKWGWIQLYTMGYALKYLGRRDTVFYINTILPVGGALAGKLTGKRVVYHYHENAKAKSRFYTLLARAMEGLADEIVCVSEYQASKLNRRKGVRVVPNALERGFAEQLRPDPEAAFERKKVMMLSSLKGYKGTAEFIGIAQEMPEFGFVLVINDSQEAIDAWLHDSGITVPENLTIHPRIDNVAPLYNEVSMVVNLSNKHEFVETFGLTALEAMSAGLPVIVPTEGGIAEMVKDGWNGYKIDVQDMEHLHDAVRRTLSDREGYLRMARNALDFSKKYSEVAMVEEIVTALFKRSEDKR